MDWQMEQIGVDSQEEDLRRTLIVRYYGDIRQIINDIPNTTVVELFHQYAIVTLPEQYIDMLAARDEIEYIEFPKSLYFDVEAGRNASCVAGVQANPVVAGNQTGAGYGLTGKGVLVGILDSGIDYSHPDFRKEDGTTRIRFLWDQTIQGEVGSGRVPAGYARGAEYTAEDINEALELGSGIPVTDSRTGHGTAVAGIAAGNGRASAGRRYRGIAIESELIIVKLGVGEGGYPRTTEVMEGLDYVLRKAIELQMPVSINLSFGNNYGPHDGQSLFENYISELNGIWKNVIVIAMGNEGDVRHHAKATLVDQDQEMEFAVGGNESRLSLQIWKQYVDEMQFVVVSPSGKRFQVPDIPGMAVSQPLFATGTSSLQMYHGEPTPYTEIQEIYLEWKLEPGVYVESGIWTLRVYPVRIRDGIIDIWMPGSEVVGRETGFLVPSVDTTLTIPSTAFRIISIGAYDVATGRLASFSGRGKTLDGRIKPTIVAPGVDIMTAAPGGGYTVHTGTSMAAPFVTGAAALMMEWGIVRNNDSNLYGEKVKAYLVKGARPLPGEPVPSERQGWGALCLRDSLPR